MTDNIDKMIEHLDALIAALDGHEQVEEYRAFIVALREVKARRNYAYRLTDPPETDALDKKLAELFGVTGESK